MSTTTERIYYDIDGTSRNLDRATRSAADGLDKVEDSFQRAKKAAQAAGGPLGAYAERAQHLQSVLAAASSPAGGLALVGLGLTVAAKLTASLARETVEMIRRSDEAADALEKQGLITKEAAEDIHGAADALDRADEAGKRLEATLSAALSPTVEHAATVVSNLEHFASDLAEALGGSGEATLAGAAIKAVTGISMLETHLDILDSILPDYTEHLDAAAAAQAALAAEAATDAADQKRLQDALKREDDLRVSMLSGLEKIDAAERLSTTRIEEQIRLKRRAADAETERSTQAEAYYTEIAVLELELLKVQQDAAQAREAIADQESATRAREVEEKEAAHAKEMDAWLEGIATRKAAEKVAAAAHAEAMEQWLDGIAERREAERAANEANNREVDELLQNQKAANLAAAQAYTAFAQSALGSLQGLVEEGSFAAKSLASLQAIVATSAAIMQAFASAPPPIAAIQAGIIGGIGAAQVAAIWAASPGSKKAPTVGSARFDRQQRHAENRAERQARRDERRDDDSAVRVEVRYRHRHYDDATDDALRRDSPLSRGLRRNRNRSH